MNANDTPSSSPAMQAAASDVLRTLVAINRFILNRMRNRMNSTSHWINSAAATLYRWKAMKLPRMVRKVASSDTRNVAMSCSPKWCWWRMILPAIDHRPAQATQMSADSMML